MLYLSVENYYSYVRATCRPKTRALADHFQVLARFHRAQVRT